MKTNSSASLTEPTYDYILNLILNKKLKPGDRVPEVEIASDLGISRTPVRNALKQLESEGLVHIYPNRFVEVSVYEEEDIQNLGIVRIAIDTMAVRLAIYRGSNEEFEVLRSIANETGYDEATEEGRTGRIRHDYDFHRQLSQISKNPILIKYQDQFLRQMEVILSYRYEEAVQASVTHAMVAEAICARDEKKAVHLITTHLAEFYHLTQKFPFL